MNASRLSDKRLRRLLPFILLGMLTAPALSAPSHRWPDLLGIPAVGDQELRILTPRVLEIVRTTRDHGWLDGLHLPAASDFAVHIDGRSVKVQKVGYRRRVAYAPLKARDLRIDNHLVLELASDLPAGASVRVDLSAGKRGRSWRARADALRISQAIHVNQVGYAPDLPKKAQVGYYLGTLGELNVSFASEFTLIDEHGHETFRGKLQPRKEQGWATAVLPYQQVLKADFTSFRTPGVYRLAVSGMGTSLPFRINAGLPAALARTYALGIYHQRCGAANVLPFTRFVHGACHTADAEVPTRAFKGVEENLAHMVSDKVEEGQGPPIRDLGRSQYPFVRKGRVNVSGGHHDAGDYSKYTINSAQMIHALIFAVDSLPGAGSLDNLGLPESGNGRSDLLELAHWETEFLARMQDADGGFYFLVYPRNRPYESDVLPDRGDPQVVFPKNTAATAAATAALAQSASSPLFRKQYPRDAARYLLAARRGWRFLEKAWSRYGHKGAYQRLTHYGDAFADQDEIAWAATELYLATGEAPYHQALLKSFDPADVKTRLWTWWRLYESYGCAIRSYAFAEKSGRLSSDRLDATHLAKCRQEILACADDHVRDASHCAYGTSFPEASKRFRTAGWYFPLDEAFDLVVAYQLDPKPEYLDAIVGNLNYEAGSNPSNVCFICGLGWRRPHDIVNQFAQNDGRSLPPSGIPVGSIQAGFGWVPPYGKELGALTFPPDSDGDNPYPLYDRWGDSFNTSTEAVTATQARCLAGLSWLMARSDARNQAWRSAAAHIVGVPKTVRCGEVRQARLVVAGMNGDDAIVVWESDRQPAHLVPSLRVSPRDAGKHWIEAEAQWPDGRRAFAHFDYTAR